MTPMDLISIVMFMLGLFLAIVMYILLKRKKLKAAALPRIIGVGAGVYVFVSFMVSSILLRPLSEFVNYTITSLFSSLAFGIVGYIGGRRIARNYHDKN
jgi:hypothetical protein